MTSPARTPAILITNDASDAAQRVIAHAARFAAATGARPVLGRVLSPLIDLASTPGQKVQDAVVRRSAEWKGALDGVARANGLAAETQVIVQQHGEDVHSAILRAAAGCDALAIAMHSRGQGALRQALLGSVAMGVLGHTVRPVMLTGPAVREPRTDGAYHLVVTSDGSAAANSVAVRLAEVFTALRGRVTLLRICEVRSGRPSPDAEMEVCERQLGTLLAALPAHLQPEAACVASSEPRVADAILRQAADRGADAIAMTTHGHSALRHLIAGSTALDLLRTVPVPLLLVRSN